MSPWCGVQCGEPVQQCPELSLCPKGFSITPSPLRTWSGFWAWGTCSALVLFQGGCLAGPLCDAPSLCWDYDTKRMETKSWRVTLLTESKSSTEPLVWVRASLHSSGQACLMLGLGFETRKVQISQLLPSVWSLQSHRWRTVLVKGNSGWVAKLGAITSLILGVQLWIRLWFQHKKGNVPLPELPWTSPHRPHSWLNDDAEIHYSVQRDRSSWVLTVESQWWKSLIFLAWAQSKVTHDPCGLASFHLFAAWHIWCRTQGNDELHSKNNSMKIYGHALYETDLMVFGGLTKWISVWRTLLMDTFLILSAPNKATSFLGSVISSCGDEDIAKFPQWPPRMESRPCHSTVPKVSEAIKEK